MSPRERKALLRNAPIAWPTLLLAAASLGGWLASTTLAVLGVIPWWVAMVLNTVAAFASFTPMHDASHRSVARPRWVNSVVGRLAALPLVAPFTAFRWLHLEHHKHTNEPEHDPDFWSGQGPTWMLPIRWLTQDLHYYVRYFGNLKRRPRAERIETVAVFIAIYALAIGLSASGHVLAVVLLWLVPGRIATALLAFSFDYLPHRPHNIPSRVDRFRATRVFVDRWLTPLFLFQNYHLVHHLYPGVPFYRYGVVWYAMADELTQKGARAEHIFESFKSAPATPRDTWQTPTSTTDLTSNAVRPAS